MWKAFFYALKQLCSYVNQSRTYRITVYAGRTKDANHNE